MTFPRVACAVVDRPPQKVVEQLLSTFSPRVECWSVDTFWLDAEGLLGLYGTLEHWAAELHQALAKQGWKNAVVVGFTRLRTLAIARVQRGSHVLKDPDDEWQQAQPVPLACLPLADELRAALALLGIHTLGEFVRLPRDELALRFGEDAAQLHRQALSDPVPLQPTQPRPTLTARCDVDPPDDDVVRLLFPCKTLVHELIAALEPRCEALTALLMSLLLDHQEPVHTRLETARPTRDVVQIMELLRLRLNTLSLAAPVREIILTAESVRLVPEQRALFNEHPRDLEAGERALARLRAMFGPQSVTVAKPADAYLPECQFRWESIDKLRPPCARTSAQPPLIRRRFASPRPLPPPPTREHERWLGPLVQFVGPSHLVHALSRTARDEYFAETQSGDLLWLFYDRMRRRWFLQGLVE